MSKGDEYDCPADTKVHCGLVPQLKPIIAAMCRAARNDALEEAAKIAESEGFSAGLAAKDFDVDPEFTCERVAERIRELKEKAA